MALAQEKYYEDVNVLTHPGVTTREKVNEGVETIPREKVATNYWRIISISIMILSILGMMTVVSSMVVTNKNKQLQDIQTNTTLMQQENDVLLQSVQELSQYDRVMEIAEKLQLQMTEDNVRNVTNEE